MFGFMKKHSEKEKEEKDKRKKEKKEKKRLMEKPLTTEELNRLEEAKRGLYRKGSDSNYTYQPTRPPRTSRNSTDGPTPSDSSDSLSSTGRETTPDNMFTSTAKMDISRVVRMPPPTQPKPKKGILKGKSNYGPEIPNQGVRGSLDDTDALEENTNLNEILSGEMPSPEEKERKEAEKREERKRSVRSIVGNLENPVPAPRRGPPSKPTLHNRAPPPPKITTPSDNRDDDLDAKVPFEENGPPSPAEKIYANVDLQLPSVAPPRCPKPRELELKRQPAGDFGFTLRRGTVLERGGGKAGDEKHERKRTVIFAEPGPKNLHTGLLPGDRLIEVGGTNVENASREEIIELIKKSGMSVMLRVQPIPELSELSMRSGLEGEDVLIGEQAIQDSTLKRSGSIRFKSRQAKSEDQLASEKAWLQAEQVWLVHKGGFAAGRMMRGEETSTEGKVKVKLDFGGEVLEVEEEDVEKRNPPQYDRVEDLANLRYLNESSILHVLRQRYGSNLVHTYAGQQALMIVNPMHALSIYSEKVIHMFRGCRPEDMPPHIYASAQQAYRGAVSDRRHQALVFLGRSGAGKTTNVRHVMHYLAVAAGSSNNFLTVDKLNWMFALLDAFGNSRTIMNTNATRYTQLVSLDLDHSGQIGAASIQVLMLEKMRIAKRPEGEPTFHVFYQMLAGVDANLRKELQLENMNEPNLFMTPLQRAEDRQKAAASWNKIVQAMTQLGLSEDEMKAITAVLAAIYHLGVAGTVKGNNNKYQFGRPAAAQRAATALGMVVDELSRTIFCAQPRNNLRSGGGDKAPVDVLTGLEALEGFVVGLYNELFTAIVSLINRALSTTCRSTTSILLLDGPGFQNPASCGRLTGSSFDDLCHNYAQERLQLLFHELVFTSQQDLYAQENIECDFEMITSSPAAMVALIDQPPSTPSLVRPGQSNDATRRGLLWLLDEEAIVTGGSDEAFLDRVKAQYGSGAEKRDGLMRRASKMTFVLNHYQGTNPVTYNTKGWLKACRENAGTRAALACLHDSQRNELVELFAGLRGSGGMAGDAGSTSSLRRTASLRRSVGTTAAGLKRKSVCVQAKIQMDTIVESLRRCRLHFVACLLPQHNAGLSDLRSSHLPPPNRAASSDDVLMNVPLVRGQLRGLELAEAVRIHRQGFPEHLPYLELRHRYDFLAAPEARSPNNVLDEKAATEKLLNNLEIDKTTYRCGLSQVFFRSGGLTPLEELRDERITGTIVSLQARCRGHLGRKQLTKLKLQHLAVSCIQRNVRKLLAIREWPWWRLYVKVKPLLNVHRTEEQLRDRETELEQLKTKLEKADKERNDYKYAVDRLEAKLSDVTADLQDEHTTSNQATDVLESEQAERLRLEKEFRELSSKHSALQRQYELTELDLHQARMIAADLDASVDEDEADGDIYRERFVRLQREMVFMKKKVQQQDDEEQERQTSIKMHMQRKVTEANEESEEQRRQVNNQKKKLRRINQEMADMKLHLEEQVSRNAELEKKQRKFDSEVHKLSEQLSTERDQREKMQRNRDEVSAEGYAAQQAMQTVQLECDMATEKAERLQKELDEMEAEGKDDKQLMAVKRMKNELERKMQEQEEELDEQAGTIQQLEQTKLRLEMSGEKLRQQHLKELEEREVELEELRGSTSKKLKGFESQLEEEYAERQAAQKEKRELERKLNELTNHSPVRDKGVERRLRQDLRRTKALLADAHTVLHRQADSATSRAAIKQVKHQLEDAEYASAAAIKARKCVESELLELQAQLDSAQRGKQEADGRCMTLTRQNNELSSRLDDAEEDYGELMKKYQASVKQLSIESATVQEQARQQEEIATESQALKEQIGQLESRVDYLQSSTDDKQVALRLEAKVRDLESRLELELTARARAETQCSRAKEQVARTTKDPRGPDDTRAATDRQLRDLRQQLSDSEQLSCDTTIRKQQLEKKVDSLDQDLEQSQADLKLAFKRIADLQAVIEDDMGSDTDSGSSYLPSDLDASDYDDLDDDLDDDPIDLVDNHSDLLENDTGGGRR